MRSYTLSELCNEIGEVLSESLAPSYWVRAEISSLAVKGGHMYLELVESQKSKVESGKPIANSQLPIAKMRATCWAGTQEMISAYFESETGQRLQPGLKVLVEAEVQWHDVYGLSLSIVGIDPSYTMGDIARQRQQTIAQLQADDIEYTEEVWKDNETDPPWTVITISKPDSQFEAVKLFFAKNRLWWIFR